MTPYKNRLTLLFSLLSIIHPALKASSQEESITTSTEATDQQKPVTINAIFIKGLKSLPLDTIMSSIPYVKDQIFDATLSSKLIKNIYSLGYFKQIEVKTEQVGKNRINIHVFLTEKTPLKDIVFEGNKHLSKEDIFKKTDLEKKPAIEAQELKKYAAIIQKLYAEKNYHFAKVTTSLKKENGQGIATFKVTEGPVAHVKKVRFTGNKTFTGKKLRSLLFTREEWVLGIMDKAGTYNPLAIEQDRYTLENFYQSNGYLHAKVSNATVEFDKKKRDITVTFHIEEGKLYKLKTIKAPGNDLVSEETILAHIPLRTGQIYSKELIRTSIENLKALWGKYGNIYADIEPSIQPDDENQTVDITFYTDPGDVVHLNRINIFGNEKARDKVIRRQLLLEEGDLLTTAEMEASKDRVASLGFFDMHDGVNWKINRLDSNTADLDLLVKEIKTGRFEFQASYGGSPGRMSSAGGSWGVQASMQERNIFGLGMQGKLTGRWGGDEKAILVNFVNPYFLDRPLHAGFDAFLSHASYDEFKKVSGTVGEKRVGASVNFGFVAKKLNFTSFLAELGLEKIDHRGKESPKVSVNAEAATQNEFQAILDERFKGGKFVYLQLNAGGDQRNHNVHISRGYKWNLTSRIAFPSFNDNVGFYKFQADGHWYTPLIGEYNLILHLHGHGGIVHAINNNRIPFRELYNIGGQASVRGWQFGQISPMWYVPDLIEDNGWQGDSIGGRKGLFFNAELVFPITSDQSMKGSVFYDGGSGWDTPGASAIDPTRLKNNSFDYRHSIGIGIRVLNPQPMRVDWGFKLDRRTGETLNEVHFSTYFDF